MKIIALNGQLGYGFTEEAFREGMARGPDVLGVDGGSTDGGPYYLGEGRPMVSRQAVRRDLSYALPAAVRRGIPLIIGSAGTGGGAPHVAWTRAIIEELAAEHGLRFRMAVIGAEIPAAEVLAALDERRVRPAQVGVPPLTPAAVHRATRIVGQMGVGPFMEALDRGADVVLAGRACDTAIFASPAIRAGYPTGLAYHMAKIAECGAHCAVPGIGADCLWVELAQDHFIVEPLHPEKYCTPVSTAAHSLYEQADPFMVQEPEGVVDVSAARFEALDWRTVRVSGSRFTPVSGRPTIKLEGAARVGFRAITVAAARDPAFICEVDGIVDRVKELVAGNLRGRLPEGSWSLRFRMLGRDAIMGEREPLRHRLPHELGLVVEALADSQDAADAVVALARSTLLHAGYPGRKATAGNLALPYSPADIPLGPAYEFVVYHLMELEDAASPFPVELVDVGGAA